MTQLNGSETSEQHTARIRHLLQIDALALKAGKLSQWLREPEITFTRPSSTAGPAPAGGPPAGGPSTDAKLKVAQEDLEEECQKRMPDAGRQTTESKQNPDRMPTPLPPEEQAPLPPIKPKPS